MRMYFEPDESEEFAAAQDLLARRCARWSDHPIDPDLVAAALAFRHYGVDGRLGYWTPATVDTYLLTWIPQEIAGRPEELTDAPETLRTVLGYLDAHHLLDPRGAPLAELEAAIDAASKEYDDAIRDTSKYGPAKRVQLEADAQGIDLYDEDPSPKLSELLMATLAESPMDLEAQLGDERLPRMPPVALGSSEELEKQAAESAVVPLLRSVVEWLGQDGRSLTKQGGVRLPDARQLSDLVDLPPQSLEPILDVQALCRWAAAVGLAREQGDRLVRTEEAPALLADPERLWRLAFDTCFDLPIFDGDFVDDEVAIDTLNAIYGMPEPCPLVRLQIPVEREAVDVHVPGENPEAQSADLAAGELERALTELARLGAVDLTQGRAHELFVSDLFEGTRELEGLGEAESPWTPEEQIRIRAAVAEPGTLVALTPLGVKAMQETLRREGREAAVIGDLTDVSASGMLGAVVDGYPELEGRMEIALWLQAHNDDVESLISGVRSSTFRGRSAAMLGAVAASVDDGSALLQDLRTDPVLGPTALSMLMSSGELAHDEVDPKEGMLGMTESLLNMLELGGAEALREQLPQQVEGDIGDLLTAVLESGHHDRAGLEDFRTLVAEPLTGQAPPRLRIVE